MDACYFLGPTVLTIFGELHLPIGLIGSLLLLVAIFIWTLRARRGLGMRLAVARQYWDHRTRVRAGALAGGLASIASFLLMNVLVALVGELAFSAPGGLIDDTARQISRALAGDTAPLAFALAVVATLGVGVVWGALYGAWGEQWMWPWLADWCKGGGFAVLPWATALIMVLPLLGVESPETHLQEPLITSEAVRHVVYGVLLGLIYPVLLVERPSGVSAEGGSQNPPGDASSAS